MNEIERQAFEDHLPKKGVFSPSLVAKAITHHAHPEIARLYHGGKIQASGGLQLFYSPLQPN